MPIIVCVLFKNVKSSFVLALIGVLCSFVYSWTFVIPNSIFTEVDIIVYLINDFTFELILAISSFLSILWLYKPCYNLLIKLIN